MKKNHMTLLLTAALMLMLCLGGCGTDKNGSTNASASPSATATATVSPSPMVTEQADKPAGESRQCGCRRGRQNHGGARREHCLLGHAGGGLGGR